MNEITIPYLFNLLLRKLYIVLISAVFCAGCAFGYCHFFATPIYSASAQLIISNGAVIMDNSQEVSSTDDISKISSTDIQASMYLSNVCVDLLQSQKIYELLAEALNNKYSYQTLRSLITVSLKEQDSIFLNVSTKNVDPEEAVKIVNTFVAMAPEYLTDYMPSAKAVPTTQSSKASLVAPKKARVTALGFATGALIAYAILLLIEINDKTITDEYNFTECYNISVLGCVPNFVTATAEGEEYKYGN